MTLTSSPCTSRARTKCDPMNPAPPVTSHLPYNLYSVRHLASTRFDRVYDVSSEAGSRDPASPASVPV